MTLVQPQRKSFILPTQPSLSLDPVLADPSPYTPSSSTILAPQPVKAIPNRLTPRKRGSVNAIASSSKSKSPVSRPPSSAERRYKCTWEGCDKAYFKPSRLAEHELSHTGQRPHVCPTCSQSYLRASHLHAHLRTHLSVEDRPFQCSRLPCEKKFWTATQLKQHEMVHDRAEVYSCPHCDETFTKTNHLRDHVTLAHMPAGTKPYQCTHEGCTSSFTLKAHLKGHEKTHDPTRYTCSHPSHQDDLPSFSVWSALQTHIKNEHPPTCHYAECNGRTFKIAQRLRDHLKTHREREIDLANRPPTHSSEDELPPVIAEGIVSRRNMKRRRSQVSDGGKSPKLVRLADGVTGKDWECDYPNCGKKYKTKNALDVHKRAFHLKIKVHDCPYCPKSYAHATNLRRHLPSHTPTPNPAGSTSQPTTPITEVGEEGKWLTGEAFLPGGTNYRRYGCPVNLYFREMKDRELMGNAGGEGLGVDLVHRGDVHEGDAGADDRMEREEGEAGDEYERGDREGRPCDMRFWRVYDVRRHLKSEHGIDLGDMEARRLIWRNGDTGH